MGPIGEPHQQCWCRAKLPLELEVTQTIAVRATGRVLACPLDVSETFRPRATSASAPKIRGLHVQTLVLRHLRTELHVKSTASRLDDFA